PAQARARRTPTPPRLSRYPARRDAGPGPGRRPGRAGPARGSCRAAVSGWPSMSPGASGTAGMPAGRAEAPVLDRLRLDGAIFLRAVAGAGGDDGERHWASAGDVIVIPYGDQHVMGGAEPVEAV